MVSPFISPATRSKITFLSGAQRQKMLEALIPAHVSPVAHTTFVTCALHRACGVHFVCQLACRDRLNVTQNNPVALRLHTVENLSMTRIPNLYLHLTVESSHGPTPTTPIMSCLMTTLCTLVGTPD